MRKMKVKTARKVRDTLMLTGVVIMLAGSVWGPFAYIGAAVAFSGLIPHFFIISAPIAVTSWEETRGIIANIAESERIRRRQYEAIFFLNPGDRAGAGGGGHGGAVAAGAAGRFGHGGAAGGGRAG